MGAVEARFNFLNWKFDSSPAVCVEVMLAALSVVGLVWQQRDNTAVSMRNPTLTASFLKLRQPKQAYFDSAVSFICFGIGRFIWATVHPGDSYYEAIFVGAWGVGLLIGVGVSIKMCPPRRFEST